MEQVLIVAMAVTLIAEVADRLFGLSDWITALGQIALSFVGLWYLTGDWLVVQGLAAAFAVAFARLVIRRLSNTDTQVSARRLRQGIPPL